ncbi:Uncharacterised protein [Mycobacteroides abscessus subsp. massiliense]|nr:Uncharacterised protein [Mycobacteroides abscessus subsp. massiliense]
MIKPGSAIISASGFMAIKGSISETKVLSLELCGRVLTVKKNFLLRSCASFEEWADYPLFLCFGQFCVGFALCFLYGKCSI